MTEIVRGEMKPATTSETAPETTTVPADAQSVGSSDGSGVDLIGRAVQDWRRERPELDTLPMELFARLGRTHRLARHSMERALETFNLTVSSMDMLLALRRAGKPYRLTPGDLAAVSLLTSGGVTFRLDRLEEAALLQRVPSTTDRRVVWAELTPRGLALAEEVVAAHVANERRLLDGMSATDVTRLRTLLQRLEASIATASGREMEVDRPGGDSQESGDR